MSPLADRPAYMSNPARRIIAYAVTALILSVVHVVFLRFISVSSVTPDLLLILTVWISLVEGQFAGTLAGFTSGLLFDVASADVLGTNALAKTIAGFVAGYFYREGMAMQIIGSYRFLLIITLSGFLHNIVYFFFYIQPMQVSFLTFFLTYGVATTLYTTVGAVFPMLFVNRRQEW